MFRHATSADPGEGDPAIALAIIGAALGTTPALSALAYRMSFYSGGVGIIDNVHFSLACNEHDALAIVTRLGLWTWTRAAADDEVVWLLRGDDERPLAAALGEFIDAHRVAFQPALGALDRLWFGSESGVNSWRVLYFADGGLHYMAFDVG